MLSFSPISSFARYKPSRFSILLISTAIAAILINAFLVYLYLQVSTNRPCAPKRRRKHSPSHLLVVLGSGGHTAEMISMLQRAPLDPTLYIHRTYVVSSGDAFSAKKAVEFEENVLLRQGIKEERSTYGGDAAADIIQEPMTEDSESGAVLTATKPYTIVTVPRARRVHQSLLTAPFSVLHCFWTCLRVLRGKLPGQRQAYPDLILSNGPATAVCVIIAAKLLRLLNALLQPGPQPKQKGDHPTQEPAPEPLRTIFIESWARVTTLSWTGKTVLPLVDRFLVQWAALDGRTGWDDIFWKQRQTRNAQGRAEFVGALVG